ncbi:WD40/YVTN repeat-like-containing domain [Phytophthora cactorum]|nr:WD40/YVTN repeat-like-containing domain [Phytophthora cactorum]
MASQDDDHHSSNGNPRPAVPAQLLPKKAAPRNSDQVRRNRMNMEKMIMKNVAASRNSTKNRAQQIVEALKRKRQQQEDTPGTHVDEAERSAKRKKSSPPHGDTAARTAVAAGILSPLGARLQRLDRTLRAPHASQSPAKLEKPHATAGESSASQGCESAASVESCATTEELGVGQSGEAKTQREYGKSTPTSRVSDESVATQSLGVAQAAADVRRHHHGCICFFDEDQWPPAAVVVRVGPGGSCTCSQGNEGAASSGSTARSTACSADIGSGNGTSGGAAPALLVPINGGPPASAPDRPSNTPTPPPKPVRKLFPSSRPVVAQRSICFSTESVATALDVTPDGEIVVVGFTDGSVRLYEMDSSVPSDRHGYLLGHLDEQSSQRSDNVHMRVKISPDGRYIFAGDRQRRRVVMSINLDHYRNEKVKQRKKAREKNTTDIVAIHGQYGYGISLMGEAYRICFPDSSNLNSSCERLPRQVFELEKLGGGGIRIFYYSNKLPDVGSSEEAHLRIIGKNASENTLFKAPMKVYTPKIKTKDKKVKSEAMLAVVTNPSDEDSEEEGGYINVDPTEAFAARWMVPSRGQDCWVCGVRNASHWVGPPESKVKEPSRAQLEAQQKEQTRVKRRQERALQRVQNAAAQQQTRHNAHDQETPSPAKPKTTPRSSAKKAAVKRQQNVQPDASGSGAVQSSNQNRRMSQHSGAGDDDDEDCTGSDDNTPSIASLMSELEHFKKRNAEIKTEWQRRLLGERQLRRKWKQREEEFLDQLNDSLTKLDAAEVEVDRLRVLLRDAEKRFAFEKARGEQENSVKSRYEQLCEQMNDKMALVADQKRLLEQTTRSLLAEVDRNVHALKNAVILEKTECVVCKDQQAVTAVVPCGHLCFCEQDAETYRRNCTTQYPTCPICQQEIVSLLRIYT